MVLDNFSWNRPTDMGNVFTGMYIYNLMTIGCLNDLTDYCLIPAV